MDMPINRATPEIMHIDLNSCFATVEQQANPLLRGRPIAVAAYVTPNGCILAPSIEAKRFGVKTGMRVKEGRLLCPELIVLPGDPPKYRAVHLAFRKIFRSYTSDVTPKSIDEAVIVFTGSPHLKRGLVTVGQEIKERLRQEVGEWISCNVGIGTNRFLAKTAASLHKPDGLDVITHTNLRDVFSRLALMDLCGINTRYSARLRSADIFTPLQFLDASLEILHKQVFRSVAGYYWYMRLRGYEVDAADPKRQTYGQSYALPKYSNDPKEISSILIRLTEKMGRRLRRAGYSAEGVHLSCVYGDRTFWHMGKNFGEPLYATGELYQHLSYLLDMQPERKKIAKLAICCFDLSASHRQQLSLFATERDIAWRASDAMDTINDTYGEHVVYPALMVGAGEKILDRIAFGGVRELLE